MQVGISLVDLAMGGAQTFLVQLANGLSLRGYSIRYFLYAPRSGPHHAVPGLLGSLERCATPVHYPWQLLACDVIQLDGYHSLWRKLPYLPRWSRCVETYHSAYSIRRSGPLYPPHRIASSKLLQSLLPEPSFLIYQGIPLPETCLDQDRPYDVVLLGRIHPVKQHLLFLQVCEKLFDKYSGLSVLLIGGAPDDGPYQSQVQAEIEQLTQKGARFHLTGDIPPEQVFNWLGQARVCLVTSQSEGLGRMAIEALACSTPVVANPVGGLLEIIQDGQNGFLARLNDLDSFAALASRLLEDESLRKSLGRAGRKMVESRFSFEAMLDAYDHLYQQIAGGGTLDKAG